MHCAYNNTRCKTKKHLVNFADALPSNERIARVRKQLDAEQVGYIGGIEPELISKRYDENGNSVKEFDSDLLNSLRSLKQAFDYDVEYLLDFMHLRT